MTKKNLWDWWFNGIDSREKERLEKLGLDSDRYSPKTYEFSDLKKMLWSKNLLEQNSHPITGQIHFIIFFSTWFCNDCMVIINGDSNYTLWICVCEKEHRNFGEWLTYNSFLTESSISVAKDKAWTLRWDMDRNHPAAYRNFSVEIIYYGENAYPEMTLVGRSELPISLSNPDQYIKPLDIVKIYWKTRDGKINLHSGIYLGSGKVVHAVPVLDSGSGYFGSYSNSYANSYSGYYNSYAGFSNFYTGGNKDPIQIIDWEEFKNFPTLAEFSKIVRIKVAIPFKPPEDIVRHIAKAWTADKTYFSRKGKFTLEGNNCEHFVNRCVLGLDFSEHGEIKKEKDARKKGETYRKIEKITDLKNQINETGKFLDSLTSSAWKSEEIKNYMSSTPQKLEKNLGVVSQ